MCAACAIAASMGSVCSIICHWTVVLILRILDASMYDSHQKYNCRDSMSCMHGVVK